MNRIRTIAIAMPIAVALSLSGPIAHAADDSVVGGWSEDRGAYTTDQGEATRASSPGLAEIRHTGKAERTTINGTTHKRSHGWTTWTGKYHYTTARLERGSTVIASSGRQWGWNGTEAVTQWVAFDPDGDWGQARTYYGS